MSELQEDTTHEELAMNSPKPLVGLVKSLAEIIESIQENPYPHVPNPPDCRKRASVALVLRIRPSYADSIATVTGPLASHAKGAPPPKTLPDFFVQSWVQNGDPEILFIKRAGRAGDRWSGHVALPGGRRDPPDLDDRAAAIRETREEVGLDLTRDDCLFAGNLPERVVTTTWGRKG
jgi:8-oxo-dGTP pyrophosphatase MutT (NUDIX family)